MILIILGSLATSAAGAEGVPEYEGVFVKLHDGGFVEIVQSDDRNGWGANVKIFRTPTEMTYDKFKVYSALEFVSFPVIRMSDIESYIVNIRGAEDFFVAELVALQDLYSETRGETYIFGENVGFEPTLEPLALHSFPILLAANNCGYGRTNYRVSYLSDNATEYKLTSQIEEDTGSFGHLAGSSSGNCGNLSDIDLFGYVIEVDGQYYPFFSFSGIGNLAGGRGSEWGAEVQAVLRERAMP